MRILILEDDPLIALDLRWLVEGLGHDVEPCESLAEARAALRDPIDYAFLDIDLPDGKSFGIAGTLLTAAIPFAFVSASRQGDLPDELRQARFIAKPYAPASIRNALTGRLPIAC